VDVSDSMVRMRSGVRFSARAQNSQDTVDPRRLLIGVAGRCRCRGPIAESAEYRAPQWGIAAITSQGQYSSSSSRLNVSVSINRCGS
jgi:hypothetical protein